jgi:hypothetical protein
MTGILRGRATVPAACTVCANNGPRMTWAPSSIACVATIRANCGFPASSFTSSWMSVLENSASAISAAFFIDCAAVPALPPADSGRINATLYCPPPISLAACCGPAGPGGGASDRGVPVPALLPAQPASPAAANDAADKAKRRRESTGFGIGLNTARVHKDMREAGRGTHRPNLAYCDRMFNRADGMIGMVFGGVLP